LLLFKFIDELIINNISALLVLFRVNYDGILLENVRIASVSLDEL